MRRKKTKESEEDKKIKWIQQLGSDYLKRAVNLNYNCQRQYVTERATKEYPDYILDFDNKMIFKDRSFPSEIGLDIEEKLRKENPNINIRIKWRETKTFKGEVVVINEYLGKYTLYKETEETNELK